MPTAQTRRRRPSQRRAKVTVDVILGGAQRVLADEGLVRATTNRIAKAAGVSIGSVYQYFPNKEAIALELSRRHTDDMLLALRDRVLTRLDAPIDEVVRAYVRANLEVHRIDPKLHQALTEVLLTFGLQEATRAQAAAVASVAGWLRALGDRVDVAEPDHAAFLLVTTVESAVHAALVTEPDRLDDPAYADELCKLLLRYIGV